mmetsp:Transcript_71296/g.215820  ORF Transcript_71296/g.215820 Transcript_71296/m.215820 type:complete len:149 (-) Transcript_71296:99-545(-)
MGGRRLLVVGGAPSLASSEAYELPANAVGAAASPAPTALPVPDIPEGRMGCQAVAMQLPRAGGRYPLCTRTFVVVLGGENGEEDWEGNRAHVRQFSSALIYDMEDNAWHPGAAFPPMLVPRTAMALCVGHGRIPGYPQLQRAGCRGGG